MPSAEGTAKAEVPRGWSKVSERKWTEVRFERNAQARSCGAL